MVKLIQKNNYWYLYYSYKENKKTQTIEKYIGKEVPKNILVIQEEFKEEVFQKRFSTKVTKIIENFNSEFKNFNIIAKQKYFSQFAIKFTYNSQAIEGSTLNLKDTALLIEEGIAPAKRYEDIENSKTHYEVFLEILNNDEDISYELILDWHKKLFEKTYPDMAGKVRKHKVKVIASKSIFSDSLNVKFDLKEFFVWYNKNKNKIHPLRLAALAHLKFVSIHPFTDGNGRVSRLIMNYILHINKFQMIDIDYMKRGSYYNALEKDQVNGHEYHFVDFVAKKFIKDYKEYL